jgi:abortive infection bacteriophage resistance protein
MTKRKFTKPAQSPADLIAFLAGKGLNISDHAYAVNCLTYLGYYRLKIYMRPFETAAKAFHPGVTFEQIVGAYNFDRRLRLHCLDAIERIEVALRAHIINVMGVHGGPHFYYDERFFELKSAVTSIRRRGEDGKHLSITHYRKEYSEPHLPPIWCLTEASTFGELSRWYADLELVYRKEIAQGFGFDESVCLSWFRCIAALRNICAHHGRLWNAELLVDTPMKAKALKSDLSNNTRCYSRLVVLMALLRHIDPGHGYGWRASLQEILDMRPSFVSLADMGFPQDWRLSQLWSNGNFSWLDPVC